jgi:thiazole/oxazole-forming peptide maturase SagD family component
MTSERIDEYRPLAVAFGKKVKNGISFVGLNDTIKISSFANEISDLMFLCNGHNTLTEIRELLPNINNLVFNKLINVLSKNQLIVDSREYYKIFNDYSKYPSTVAHNFTSEDIDRIKKTKNLPIIGKNFPLKQTRGILYDLIKKRKTCRSFLDRPITKKDFSGLLQSMYSLDGVKSVASAGGLYQLRIYACLLKKIGNLKKGIYRYSPHLNSIVLLNNDNIVSTQKISMLIDSATMAINSSALICVVSDSKKTTYKYSNRGYRYLLLEAGHIAQNAYLYAAETNLGIVEYGGYNDQELAEYLGLTLPSETVNITFVVGVKNTNFNKDEFKEDFVDEEWRLRNNLIGVGKPIMNISTTVFHYKSYVMPYYAASVKYMIADPYNNYKKIKTGNSFGLGTCLAEAKIKALAEAYERYISGFWRIDKKTSERKLQGKIFDISKNAPQSKKYLNKMNLTRRITDSVISWVEGLKYISKEKVYIPVEQVYYPVQEKDLKTPISYKANSTGVSAHKDYERAFNNALYELIERDAIAVTWYAKRIPDGINQKTLSEDIKYRINYLNKLGREVKLLDITLETIPVVLCVITGDSFPYFVSGCSANPNIQEAILKALNEAEFMLHSWRTVKRDRIIMNGVSSSTDHADFYAQTHINKNPNIKWLLSGKIKNIKKYYFSKESLIKKVDPIVIDLNKKDVLPCNLRVLRVMSEKLMPLTFGYMSEHYKHPRLSELGLKWGWDFPAPPHFFA